jgi:hypothetical protein
MCLKLQWSGSFSRICTVMATHGLPSNGKASWRNYSTLMTPTTPNSKKCGTRRLPTVTYASLSSSKPSFQNGGLLGGTLVRGDLLNFCCEYCEAYSRVPIFCAEDLQAKEKCQYGWDCRTQTHSCKHALKLNVRANLDPGVKLCLLNSTVAPAFVCTKLKVVCIHLRQTQA